MKASVIIVAHAGAHHLDDSLGSLSRDAESGATEVVLVDNGSDDRCGDEARRRFPWVKTVRSNQNLGFAGGVHLGAEVAAGDVLVLLNDDASAEDGLVEVHRDALANNPRAAVSAGRLLSWDGAKHDFVRGAVTFDCHAFQLGLMNPVDEIEPPAAGEGLPFACGGNLAIRREDWDRSGGFDRHLFAYFEDVDLGWRLWAIGREVIASPGAVARHRGAATSARLGNFRRGVLFERNALRTFHACADEECRSAFGGAVYATFLHRLAAFAASDPKIAEASADPFGGAAPPPSRRERWRRRLREKGLAGAARHLLARTVLGPKVGSPSFDDGLLLMQLRAARGFFSALDQTDQRRVQLDAARIVPDREILARFPRLVVPTYAGDQEWFDSDAFRALLPDDWPLEFRRLDEIMRLS
jgi:GT2 family glycosyltransferase